jgi:hypothetical protein
MDDSSKKKSLRDFERMIYPIWKGIQERDVAADEKRPIIQGEILWECATLHKQDIAIYESGIKPNRFDVDSEAIAKLRKKSLRASGN